MKTIVRNFFIFMAGCALNASAELSQAQQKKVREHKVVKESQHLSKMIEAAFKAGQVVMKGFRKIEGETKEKSENPNDVLTEYDLASQKTIIDYLKASFPNYKVLAEEGKK